MTRPGDVLRSVAFYPAFYVGSVLIVSACALFLLLGSQRRFMAAIQVWSGWHRTCARILLGIEVRTEGTVPTTPVLVVLKHESFFEAIDLTQLLDKPGVFAKAELMRIPVWGKAGRRYGLVEVQREQGAKALRHMLAAARAITAAGRPLALFPEGTRVPSGEVHDIKSGFAGLYKLLALPVVPVAVDSGRLYQRWWKRPGTITYRFGETIPPGLPRDEAEARVIAAINVFNKQAIL
jgi:1-acyl-sn-glycerol-3-phosphate acyltransferase